MDKNEKKMEKYNTILSKIQGNKKSLIAKKVSQIQLEQNQWKKRLIELNEVADGFKDYFDHSLCASSPCFLLFYRTFSTIPGISPPRPRSTGTHVSAEGHFPT